MGTVMVLVGFVICCAGLFSVLSRRPIAWARLGSQKSYALSIAGGIIVMIVGGTALSPPTSSTASRTPVPLPSVTTGSLTSSPSPTSTVPSRSPSVTPTPTDPDGPTGEVAVALSRAKESSALAAVALLAVKGRSEKSNYTRAAFGQEWYDTDRNGCDQRNDILRRDLTNLQIKAGTRGCKVNSGDAAPEKYTGEAVHFEVGGRSEIDIDHVVALSDAWQKGAQGWDENRRRDFATDPLNLLAVSASANRSKGDGDTATWLPPNKGYRCAYVARQVAVKKAYALWVTAAERDAMVRVLSTCPEEPLPEGGNVPLTPEPARPASTTKAPQPAPQPAPPPANSGGGGDVYYKNCTEARAAGAAPIYRGQPGYAKHLDQDNDGVACE